MIPDSLERVLERTAQNLFAARTAEAALAGREGDTASASTVDAAVTAMAAAQEEDGSWGGDLVYTAESMLLLDELGGEGAEMCARRALVWLIGRQNAPGRFGDGCDPRRHSLGFCHHFLTGFFSAAPGSVPVTDVTLASGARIEGDQQARLAASALALHAALVWGASGSAIELHVDAIARMIRERADWQGTLVEPATLLVLVGAMLHAPSGLMADAATRRGVELTVRGQRADGTWPEADTFQAAEVLLACERDDRFTEQAAPALRRVARLLINTQQRDGTWGRETGPRRLLTAWRVLRYASANESLQPSTVSAS